MAELSSKYIIEIKLEESNYPLDFWEYLQVVIVSTFFPDFWDWSNNELAYNFFVRKEVSMFISSHIELK